MKNNFNEWIRTCKGADGCIDFDKAVRSEESPFAFDDGYDSGDHLRPSDAAYKVMGELAYRGIQK